jgi:hypothetical protein
MAKIQLGADFIVDASKANASLEYHFVPDINVPAGPKGSMVGNKELGEENGIWLLKKHLTAGDKARLNMRINSDGTMSLPMTEVWKASVLEVHGLYDGEKELGPLDILNAVGSVLADALIVQNYHDSMENAKLTENERKN